MKLEEKEIVKEVALHGVTNSKLRQTISEAIDEAFASMDRGDTEEQRAILDKELSDRILKVARECSLNI